MEEIVYYGIKGIWIYIYRYTDIFGEDWWMDCEVQYPEKEGD